jgi:hypothetical protein
MLVELVVVAVFAVFAVLDLPSRSDEPDLLPPPGMSDAPVLRVVLNELVALPSVSFFFLVLTVSAALELGFAVTVVDRNMRGRFELAVPRCK